MRKTVVRVIFIVLLVVTIAYAGTCAYANFFASSPEETSSVKLPSVDKAMYSLVVNNTGTVILTDSYEEFGDKIGARTYVLHGYWELRGKEFRYIPGDITLSETLFGEITMKVRAK